MAGAKRGNPNWRKGGPSPNPSGRPAVAEVFREKARAAVDGHVLKAWIDEVQVRQRIVGHTHQGAPIEAKCRGKDWMRASENLAAYGYGKPIQPVSGPNGGPIEVKDVRELSRAELLEIAAGGK